MEAAHVAFDPGVANQAREVARGDDQMQDIVAVGGLQAARRIPGRKACRLRAHHVPRKLNLRMGRSKSLRTLWNGTGRSIRLGCPPGLRRQQRS